MTTNDKILDAWIKVEQLSEGSIVKKNEQYQIFQGTDYKETLRKFLSKKIYRSHSTPPAPGVAICCGIFEFQEIINRLRSKYGLKATEEELTTSEKFTFALYFDKDLNFLADKLFLTMSGYIYQRKSLPDNFIKVENDFRERVEKEFLDGHFNEVLTRLLNEYSISPKDCRYYFVNNLDEDTHLHSFFINDLEQAKSFTNKNLNQYLSGFQGKYINLDSDNSSKEFNQNALEAILDPKNYPLGRFPSSPERALSMMQQVAVNVASHDNENIRSVNGPPGTGKTTLLRDIFADLITEQAAQICNLGSQKLKGDSIAHLPTDIADKGIVVASSNNGALKNIVDEIPHKKTIGKESCFLSKLKTVDYFANIINDLHSEGSDVVSQKYWGLLLAEGGNKQNRECLQYTLGKVNEELHSETFQSNPAVYKEFQKQYLKLFSKRKEMQHIADKFRLRPELENELEEKKTAFEDDKVRKALEQSDIQKRLDQLDNLKKKHEAEQVDCRKRLNAANDEKQIAQQDLDIIKLQAPSFLWIKKIFTPSATQTYFEKLNQAHTYVKDVSKRALLETNRYNELQADINRYKIEKDHLHQQQDTDKKWESDTQAELDKLQAELEKFKSGKLDFSISYEKLQISNP